MSVVSAPKTHKRRPGVKGQRRPTVHATRDDATVTLCGTPIRARGPLAATERRRVTCGRCSDAISAEDDAHPCEECNDLDGVEFPGMYG